MNNIKYKTYVFDCDGVLLDSNRIKSEAFYKTALPYGEDKAFQLLQYHRANGGISRFEKFRFFFDSILQRSVDEHELKRTIENYAENVYGGLLACEETPSVQKFLSLLPDSSRKIVVSGGMETELREVFKKRNLDSYFDAIYGSPNTKYEILKREIEQGLLKRPAVFFGDSRLVYEVATEYDIDFVFLKSFTEFEGWEDYFKTKDVIIISTFVDLLDGKSLR